MDLTIAKLETESAGVAAALLGRAMRDNPINRRAFAIADDAKRERVMTRFFVPVVQGMIARAEVLGAWRSGDLVGVLGLAPPSKCQPNASEKLKIAPVLLFGASPATALRVMSWTGAWMQHDPKTPHWHLGPVAVEEALQGKGIGQFMMREFCRRMDAAGGGTAYLETDKPENVRFYQQFGFRQTDEDQVLGIPNWFMCRPASR